MNLLPHLIKGPLHLSMWLNVLPTTFFAILSVPANFLFCLQHAMNYLALYHTELQCIWFADIVLSQNISDAVRQYALRSPHLSPSEVSIQRVRDARSGWTARRSIHRTVLEFLLRRKVCRRDYANWSQESSASPCCILEGHRKTAVCGSETGRPGIG